MKCARGGQAKLLFLSTAQAHTGGRPVRNTVPLQNRADACWASFLV